MFLTKFDAELEKIEIFQKYPEMLPAIGENYSSDQHKKILIVAESHYLPEGSTVQNDVEGWYRERLPLTQKEREYMDTKGVVSARSSRTLPSLERALGKAGVPQSDNLFREVAYMNYFRRPAIYKESLPATEIDKQVALETFLKVLEIIRPNAIFFVSTSSLLAAEEGVIWEKMNGTPYDYSPHPACAWWHKESAKHRGLTGEEKFIEFLKEQFFK